VGVLFLFENGNTDDFHIISATTLNSRRAQPFLG